MFSLKGEYLYILSILIGFWNREFYFVKFSEELEKKCVKIIFYLWVVYSFIIVEFFGFLEEICK